MCTAWAPVCQRGLLPNIKVDLGAGSQAGTRGSASSPPATEEGALGTHISGCQQLGRCEILGQFWSKVFRDSSWKDPYVVYLGIHFFPLAAVILIS